MGDTLHLARQLDLMVMEPRGDLSSTRYVLAHHGQEYLVLQPDETANPITVSLGAGTYAVRWHGVASRETRDASPVKVENRGNTTFSVPLAEAGPAVLYLKRDES